MPTITNPLPSGRESIFSDVFAKSESIRLPSAQTRGETIIVADDDDPIGLHARIESAPTPFLQAAFDCKARDLAPAMDCQRTYAILPGHGDRCGPRQFI